MVPGEVPVGRAQLLRLRLLLSVFEGFAASGRRLRMLGVGGLTRFGKKKGEPLSRDTRAMTARICCCCIVSCTNLI